jgi:hypothetical protein
MTKEPLRPLRPERLGYELRLVKGALKSGQTVETIGSWGYNVLSPPAASSWRMNSLTQRRKGAKNAMERFGISLRAFASLREILMNAAS